MLILGVESATARVSCAIGGHEGVLAETQVTKGRRHCESLAPQIDFALKQSGFDISEIAAVAVDVGPGLYTGLRVGISTAMSIAFSLSVPMVGINSLDLLTFPLRHSRRLVAAAIDARRGEVFTALYKQVPGGMQRLSEPKVVPPRELANDLMAFGEDCLLVGDGALRYRDEFTSIKRIEIADPSLAYPSAGSLVSLAHPKALREDFVAAREIKPMYLRRPDAEANWISRGSDSNTESVL